MPSRADAAVLGGWVASGLAALTNDVAALESAGRGVVVLPFDRPPRW